MWALKPLDSRYSKAVGLGQTVFRASESFSLVIIPHDFGVAATLMNQKARKIGLILLSSVLFLKKHNSLEDKFPTDFVFLDLTSCLGA